MHKKKGAIAVIGDSHSRFFSGAENSKMMRISNMGGGIYMSKIKDPRFTCFHLGPVLAYKIDQYGSSTQSREKIEHLLNHFLEGTGKIIFTAGEIDLRVWVLRKAKEADTNYEVIIRNIVKAYVEFAENVKNMGYEVWLYGPIPSQKDNVIMNPDYPRYGTEVERNLATEYFNKVLREECKLKGVGSITVYDYLITSDFRTKNEYQLDGCHLNEKARPYLLKELMEQGIVDNV